MRSGSRCDSDQEGLTVPVAVMVDLAAAVESCLELSGECRKD